MNHTKRLFFVATVLSLAAITLWWRFRSPPQLEFIARTTIEAIEAGDGEGSLRFVDSQEIEMLQLTPQKISQVLAALNAPLKSASSKGTTISIDPMADIGMLIANKSTPLSNGKLTELEVIAAKMDGGPRIRSLVHSLLMYGISAEFPAELSKRRGLAKLEIALRELPKIAKVFQEAGITGVYFGDTPSPFIKSWETLEQEFRAKVESARAKSQSPQ